MSDDNESFCSVSLFTHKALFHTRIGQCTYWYNRSCMGRYMTCACAHTHTHFNQIFIFFMLVTLWKLANKKLPDWQWLKKTNIKRTEYTLKFSYKLLVKAVSVNSWSFKMYVSWSWFIFSHIFFFITVKYKKDHFFGRFKAIFTTTQHNTT